MTWMPGSLEEVRTRTVRVVAYRNLITREGRQIFDLPVESDTPLWSVLGQVATDVESNGGFDVRGPLAVLIDGVAVNNDLNRLVKPDAEVIIAPKPQGLETLVLIGIALASIALSMVLAPKVKISSASSGTTPEEQRFGFARVSNDAVAGDTIQVVMGEHPAYGGKVIGNIPTDDALGSGKSRLKLLICLGRGPVKEIGGLTSDVDDVAHDDMRLKIKLNDQPIANFPGCRVSARMGSSGQAVIPGFKDAELLQEVGVGGTTLRNTSGSDRSGGSASGEAFTVTTADVVNAIVVRVRFAGGLYRLSDTGQLESRTVAYRIRARLHDVGGGTPGSWSTWESLTLSRAERAEFVSAPRYSASLGISGAAARYDVQMERVSAEVAGTQVSDTMVWEALIGVQNGSYVYAGKGLLALDLEASEQLTTTPRVTIGARGLAGLRVHDGVSSSTSPTFVTAYSNVPADLALETLTNAEWGMGVQYSDANIDFESLLSWRGNCIEMVASRLDPTGARMKHVCDLVMDTAKDAYDWLITICATGRCRPVWDGRRWRFVYDGPQSAVELITDGSLMTDETGGGGKSKLSLHYEHTEDGYQRPNRLVAQIASKRLDGRSDAVSWPPLNTLWLATEELVESTVQLPGITDPEQAIDELIYQLKRDRLTKRTATLTDARPIVVAQPGERIDIATSLVGWGRASGRVLSGGTTTSLRIDQGVELEAGVQFVVRVQQTDGSIEVRTIASPEAFYAAGDVLTVTTAFVQAPALGALYALGRTGIEAKPFLCESIRLMQDDAGTGMVWAIGVREYNAEIYENDEEIELPPVYSDLLSGRSAPGPVLSLTAAQRKVGNTYQVELSWRQKPADANITTSYRIYRRIVGTSTWVLVPIPSIAQRSTVLEITDDGRGYQFAVVAVSVLGSALSPYDAAVPYVTIVLGLAETLPDPPTGLTATNTAGNAYKLEWTAAVGAAEYAVLTGGVTTGAVHVGAEDCFVLARTANTYLENLELPSGQACRYWVRSVNTTGRMSGTAPTVNVATAATPAGKSIKDTQAFDLSSAGTLTNLTWNATTSRLELTSTASPGVWLSAEIDTGSPTLGELTIGIGTANDADDVAIEDLPMTVPSVEADQWGIVSTGPKKVGMLWQPYPDNAVGYLVEIRTHDGLLWSGWSTLPHQTSIERLLEKYQIRITMNRTRVPYRPALRTVVAVVTH